MVPQNHRFSSHPPPPPLTQTRVRSQHRTRIQLRCQLSGRRAVSGRPPVHGYNCYRLKISTHPGQDMTQGTQTRKTHRGTHQAQGTDPHRHIHTPMHTQSHADPSRARQARPSLRPTTPRGHACEHARPSNNHRPGAVQAPVGFRSDPCNSFRKFAGRPCNSQVAHSRSLMVCQRECLKATIGCELRVSHTHVQPQGGSRRPSRRPSTL